MKKSHLLIIFLLPIYLLGKGNNPILGMTGPNSVAPNSTQTYDCSNCGAFGSPYWVVSGGTINGSNTGTSVSITWGSGSSGTVTYKTGKSTILGSMNVTIGSPPSMPSSPSIDYNCTTAILTRGNPPSGTTWYWQTSSGGTSQSNSSTTWSVNSNGTYYLRANNSFGWSSARSISVSADTSVPTANVTSSASSVCVSGSVTFTAGSVYDEWYTSASGGTPFHTGTTYTENITSTKTYYVEAVTGFGCRSTSRDAVTVTRYAQTVAGTISGASTSCGSGAMNFTISGHTGTIERWQSRYKNGSGGWSGWSIITESNNVTSVNPTLNEWSGGQRTYEIRATIKSGSCNTLYPKKTVIINPTPALASGSNQARCGSGTVTLTASTGSNGNNIRWYAAASGGSVLHTGTSYTTPSLSSTTTYYAASYNSSTGCQDSDRKAITATINPIPSLAGGSNQARCGTGTVTLTASTGSNGNNIRWYASASGGSVLSTSTSYTTPSLSSSTTYYAASYNSTTGCEDADRKAITATIQTIPSLASGSNQARCGTGTVTLTASTGSNGNNIRWYAAASGGSRLHTGTSYTTPSLSSTTTYYAASYNSTTGCEDSDRKAITATINPIPGLASGSGQSRCGNGTVTLTASTGSNGNNIRWYAAASGGSLLSTGTSYTTPSLSSSTTYYAASYNSTTGCEDSDRKAITATINPIPGLASGSSQSRCGNGTVTLTASTGSNGNNIRWYAAASGGSVLFTGTSYTTPSLSSSTTYYAASYNSTTGCEDLDRKAITATITPQTVGGTISSSTSTQCGSGNVNFSISGHLGTISYWQYRYKNGSGSYNGWTVFEQTDNLTSVNLTLSEWSGGQRTYQIRARVQNQSCNNVYPNKTVIISTIPSLASGSNQARCGTGTVTLTASTGSNGNNIRWYAAASGGSVLHTGTSYTTASLSSSTTYYAASYNSTTGCQDPDRKAITATINPIPGLASGSNQARCGTGTVTLTASTGSNGNNIRWYAAASGGSVLSTGASYTTPSLSSSTTYYAASYNSTTGCEDSDRKAITATINSIPGLASGNGQSRCGNGTVTLTASTGSNGNNIRWYAAASGGSVLSTSTSYTTPSLSSSTTYYAASYNSTTGCEDSDRKAITATVIPQTVGGTISSSTGAQCGSGTINFTIAGNTGTIERWESRYKNGSGSWTGWTLITESNNVTSVNPTLSEWSGGQRTYEIRATIQSGSCNTLYPNRTVIINTIPSLASGSNQARCGTGTVTLTASTGSNGNNIRWYAAASGGSVLHTGTSYTTSSLSATTTYYAASYNSTTGCQDADRKAITATINPIPGLASGSNQARCGTGTVTLTASTGSNGNNIRWYAAVSGGSVLSTGTSYTTPSLSASTTYCIVLK